MIITIRKNQPAFEFKYTDYCPTGYFVWPICRKHFSTPCCIPLCCTDKEGNIDEKHLLYMKMDSERIATAIMAEAEQHKVVASRIKYLVENTIDKQGYRMKSIEMVVNQYNKMQKDFTNSPHLTLASKILLHYVEAIKYHAEICLLDVNARYNYIVRSYTRDTPSSVVRTLPDKKVEGLYATDENGNKMTPTNLYFGSDTRFWFEKGDKCGGAYYRHCSTLYPVYLNGKRFRINGLCAVCCHYKNGVLTNWYRE